GDGKGRKPTPAHASSLSAFATAAQRPPRGGESYRNPLPRQPSGIAWDRRATGGLTQVHRRRIDDAISRRPSLWIHVANELLRSRVDRSLRGVAGGRAVEHGRAGRRVVVEPQRVTDLVRDGVLNVRGDARLVLRGGQARRRVHGREH